MGYGQSAAALMGQTGYFDVGANNLGDISGEYYSGLNSLLGSAGSLYNQYATYEPYYAQTATQSQANSINTLSPVIDAANSASRASTAGDYSRLAPGVMKTYQGLDPSLNALTNQLVNTASQNLGYGSALSADQQRASNQYTRAGQASRGLGYGPGDVVEESLAGIKYGDQLQQMRAAQANTAAGTRGNYDATGNSILSSLLGDTSTSTLASSLGSSDASASNNYLTTGTQAYDTYNTAYNSEASTNATDASNKLTSMEGDSY